MRHLLWVMGTDQNCRMWKKSILHLCAAHQAIAIFVKVEISIVSWCFRAPWGFKAIFGAWAPFQSDAVTDQGPSVHLRFCFWGFAWRTMTRWTHNSFQTMATHTALKLELAALLFDIWKFGLSRAFIIEDKFSCDGKENCPLETLPGNCTLCSWDMFLTHCTTTFQLCIMQLLLALMSYKVHILILFLETGCSGMQSFGLLWGVRWSRGALCTLVLCWIPGSKPKQGSGLQLWISKVKERVASGVKFGFWLGIMSPKCLWVWYPAWYKDLGDKSSYLKSTN